VRNLDSDFRPVTFETLWFRNAATYRKTDLIL